MLDTVWGGMRWRCMVNALHGVTLWNSRVEIFILLRGFIIPQHGLTGKCSACTCFMSTFCMVKPPLSKALRFDMVKPPPGTLLYLGIDACVKLLLLGNWNIKTLHGKIMVSACEVYSAFSILKTSAWKRELESTAIFISCCYVKKPPAWIYIKVKPLRGLYMCVLVWAVVKLIYIYPLEYIA